jgi:hypothetical protein
MAGENSALFRVTNTGDNEGNVPADEKILFNPDSEGGNDSLMFATEVFYRNSIPENPKVAGPINEVQDMGLDGIDVQLTTKQLNSSNATAGSVMDILRKWLVEEKTLPDFAKGRFGLRLDDIPIFNVTPQGSPNTPEFGYVFANARFTRPQDMKNKADLILTFRFSGDPTGLGT